MSQWQDAEQFADRALEMYECGRLAEAENALREAGWELPPRNNGWLHKQSNVLDLWHCSPSLLAHCNFLYFI